MSARDVIANAIWTGEDLEERVDAGDPATKIAEADVILAALTAAGYTVGQFESVGAYDPEAGMLASFYSTADADDPSALVLENFAQAELVFVRLSDSPEEG